jgi:hypothetical protein
MATHQMELAVVDVLVLGVDLFGAHKRERPAQPAPATGSAGSAGRAANGAERGPTGR